MKQSSESSNFVLEIQQSNIPIGNVIEGIFNNINMAQVLGNMYYKYKYFKIVLNSYCGWVNTGATYSPTNVVYVGLTGLNFINTTYNGQLSNIARFPNAIILPPNGGNVANFSIDNNGIVFRKPDSPVVNLRLSLLNPRNSSPLTVLNILSTGLNFNFTIYGLYEEDE
jgi:hypothetical protein